MFIKRGRFTTLGIENCKRTNLFLKKRTTLWVTRKRFPGFPFDLIFFSEFPVEWFAFRKFKYFSIFWNFFQEIYHTIWPLKSAPLLRRNASFQYHKHFEQRLFHEAFKESKWLLYQETVFIEILPLTWTIVGSSSECNKRYLSYKMKINWTEW